MTSKNLFFKLIKQDFKKRIWCPIIIFIAFFLALEVILLMETENMIKYPDLYAYDIVTFVREYFFGRDMAAMAWGICGAAFLCGISGFAYLHSKTQMDTYHSLPVSRSQLFWSKYISGILQFFIPFVLHTLISAGIAAGRKAFTIETVPSMLSFIGLALVIFWLTYSMSVIAVELTGNIIVSILGTGVLVSYSMIVSAFVTVLFERFFRTYVTYGRMSVLISEEIWCFSPLSMILKLFTSPNNTTMEKAEKLFKYDTSYIWVLIVAAVVYSLAAYFIYLKRASEAAGKSIAFRVAEPVIKTMIVIPFSFFTAYFFSVVSSSSSSDGWFLFGLIFGFIILCILMEIIFRLDIRSAFMHKKQFLFNAVCIALIFIVLKYDVTGYDTYVPSDSQIQSCAVSIHQLMPLSQNIRLNDFGRRYVSPVEYRMANMEIQGNPNVMALARKAAKEQLEYQIFDYYEGIEETPGYIETLNRQENYKKIGFGYKLRNGKTIYRDYIIDLADTDTLALLSEIFNDSDYKIGSAPVFNDNWKVAFEAVYCMNNFKGRVMKLTPDMQAKLIETYQKEYMGLTLDTVMHVMPVGTIDFWVTYNDRSRLNYSDEMEVYPQFTETIALLRTYGFDMEEKMTADDVESISVYEDIYNGNPSYYRGASLEKAMAYDTPVEESAKKYTDKEQIQQILDSVINDKFSWQLDDYADYFDDQYNIEIRFKTDDNTYSSYRFIKGQIPDFVKISEKSN